MWFVALSHRPHFPSLPLSVSLSLVPSMWRGFFLPSFGGGRPTGKLNRIASLRWLTPEHRELHSTPPSLQPRQPTSPHPGLDPSSPRPACLYVSLSICLYRCFFCIFLLCLVALSRCLIVYLSLLHLPACFSTSLCCGSSYSLSLFRSAFTACQPVLFASLPAFLSLFFSLSLGNRLQSQNSEGHRASTPPSAF